MEIILTVLTSVLIALATSFFSSRFYVLQAKADLQKEFESRFNERKWDTYSRFTDTVRQVFETTRRPSRDQSKIVAEVSKFARQLWLVGSDDVIRATADWLRYTRQTDEQTPADVFRKLHTVFLEMRRDLGYKSTAIDPQDMLIPFVRDIDNYLRGFVRGS